MCIVFVYKFWVVSCERIMSKNIKEDEIPLTFSSPALSETKAKFDSLLRVAIEKYPKEKKKSKGVEERRKPKQKPKIVHSSLPKPEASEGYSLTYGSSSQLLPHDAEFSSSREEEEAVENPSKANRHSQNQNVDVSELIAMPENHKQRNNEGGADGRTDVRKWSSDASPRHKKRDADVPEESFEGENSSGSVDNRSSIKRPVPLPRTRTRVCAGALVSNSVTSYKSEDESGTDTHKSLVVEALVSAADGAPLFTTDRGSPGTRNAGGRLEPQSYEEIQMAELNSPKEKPPGHKVSHKISKKGKRTRKKHYDSEEEEIVTDDVARVCDPIIDSLQMENTDEPSECTGTRNEPAPSTYSYEKIVGVFVHNSDCLQPDLLVRHPLVKVHLICADTGQYLKKSSVDRSVSFFYENETVDYILPLMTESYDFRQRRSILPSWEELLVFNEDIEYILNPDLSVVIMFEILDFVSFSLASARYKKLGTEGGWYKIAWAFLKPVGKNGVLNIDKKLRLQLYKPQSSQSFSCDACEPYLWWSSGQWSRYPGSLYVTVKGIHPPGDLPPALRSRSALQGERGSCRIVIEPDGDGLEQTSSPAATPSAADAVPDSLRPNWSRLPSQSCRVPNRRALTLDTPPRGCFAVSFSSSGLFLACALASQDTFAIAVYTIPEGMEYVRLPAHQGLVYDLRWSHDDAALLSASADCTACVWDVPGKRRQPSHLFACIPAECETCRKTSSLDLLSPKRDIGERRERRRNIISVITTKVWRPTWGQTSSLDLLHPCWLSVKRVRCERGARREETSAHHQVWRPTWGQTSSLDLLHPCWLSVKRVRCERGARREETSAHHQVWRTNAGPVDCSTIPVKTHCKLYQTD
ncbi:jouberin-like isoform X2 [Bacillus rossius redtenbacheri]|uniref:jouberin-like isoform X2 n=1 Tax=Bacillus rossius redtenbacheri TaxID=93214 RepID=UPI002FDDA7CF